MKTCLYCGLPEGSSLDCSNPNTGHRYTVEVPTQEGSFATIQQPTPTPAAGDVWLEVVKDMEERRKFGIAKYGTPVQISNGRDALLDAYQEALDLAVYLKQAIMEREEHPTNKVLQNLEDYLNSEVEYQHWDMDRTGREGIQFALEAIRRIRNGEGVEE